MDKLSDPVEIEKAYDCFCFLISMYDIAPDWLVQDILDLTEKISGRLPERFEICMLEK